MRRALLILVFLLIAAPAQAEIPVVDTSTGTTSVPVRSHATRLLGWGDDGAALRIDGYFGVQQITLSDRAVALEPEWLWYVRSIGPGGRSLAEAEANGVVLRAADGRIVLDGEPNIVWDAAYTAWSADGRRAAIAIYSQLLVLDTDTGAVLLRRRGGASITPQAFAPDGSALLATVGRRVLRLDLASGASTLLYKATRPREVQAAWSSNGRMAFTIRGGIAVPGFPGIHAPIHGPALWSADGTTLAYLAPINEVCGDYGERGVAVVAPGGAPRTLIEPSTRIIHGVRWAPVGTRLAIDLGAPPRPAKRGKRHPWPKSIGHDYSMTRAGDAAARRAVVRFAEALKRGATREEALLGLHRDLALITRDALYDTAVSESLGWELDAWLSAAGYAELAANDEITC